MAALLGASRDLLFAIYTYISAKASPSQVWHEVCLCMEAGIADFYHFDGDDH